MSSFFGITRDLHTTLPASRQDGDPLLALGLGLAERPDHQLLGLKTEHKAGARTSGKVITVHKYHPNLLGLLKPKRSLASHHS
jgi:hypothetical protein